jgi:hypothetical protein
LKTAEQQGANPLWERDCGSLTRGALQSVLQFCIGAFSAHAVEGVHASVLDTTGRFN